MELLKPEFSFIFPLIMLIVLGVYIYSLVDILKHEFRGNNKIVWIIVVLMLPLLGVFLYFLLGKKQQSARVL
ncbi:PLD nuclease N-terminal domain-containing protein [Croceibacter atlanticus]|jgi:carbon starvation protein CstA|uniref:PLD nuclease N-terminal domain-containing protein n=1 Tax=Croceibacter atlanticus TaxID=313588 RepID=UPI0032162993